MDPENRFEYRVVPAPIKGRRVKGIRGAQARFAHALELLMNELGAQGWEYIRTDTLPAEERQGLTSKVTVFQNMLVFRRALAQETSIDAELPQLPAPPVPQSHLPALTAVSEALDKAPDAAPANTPDATWDVEPLAAPAHNAGVPVEKLTVVPLSPKIDSNGPSRDRPAISPALAARAARLKARATAAE